MIQRPYGTVFVSLGLDKIQEVFADAAIGLGRARIFAQFELLMRSYRKAWSEVIPVKFEYYRATDVSDAIDVLASARDAKVIAGGHSLLPLMKLRFASPMTLVDIGRISSLSYILDRGEYVAIGALTSLRDIETSPILKTSVPILSYAASFVGDPSVRHRATIGGSVVHGDAAGDLPSVMLAVGATVVLQGPDGKRSVSVDDFFLGFLETNINFDEVLLEIQVPKSDAGWARSEFNRRAQDWAIVGVAVLGGKSPRVSLINMASTPIRAFACEDALVAGGSIKEAADLVSSDLDPPEDLNATSAFRSHLANVLVRRALERSL